MKVLRCNASQRSLEGFDPAGNTLVLADCSLGDVGLSLPDVRSLSPNCSFTIVKSDSSLNTVDIVSILGQKISGQATASIDTQFTSITFHFDQSSGYYISKGSPSGGGSGTIALPVSRIGFGNATSDGIASDARLTFDAALGKLVVDGAVTASTYMAAPSFKFDGTTPASPAEGEIWYDTTDNTLMVQSDISNTTLNVGQEQLIRCGNYTGSLIADGKVVYISGAQGNRPKIELASYTDENSANKTIGVVTADIAHGAEGYVCIQGVVQGYNTSAFSAGDRLYLYTNGTLTKTAPAYGIAAVAYALNSTNNGRILVVLHRGITVDGAIPFTGFNDPDLVTSVYDPATQKITLSGTAIFYYRGVAVFDLNAGNHVSSARTTGNGIWFYYYNGTSYVWSLTPWTFDMGMLGIVYKSATAEFGICEPHGYMEAPTHRRLHEEIGTSRIGTSGVASSVVTGSTTAANRRPAFTASVIRDEDITTTIDAQTDVTYTRMHIGASSTTVFTTGSSDIVELTGNLPRVNNPSDGSFTTLGASEYMNVFVIDVPTMSDTGSKVYRRWFLNGQYSSLNKTLVDSQAISSLNLGDINPLYLEFVFGYRYLIRREASNWVVVSENRLTGNKTAQVSSPSVGPVALSNLATGGLGCIPYGDATGHSTDANFKYLSSVFTVPNVTIPSGGKLGVGKTPTAILDVSGAIATDLKVQIIDAGGTANSAYTIDINKTGNASAPIQNMFRNRDGTSYVAISLQNNDGNNNCTFGRMGETYSGSGYTEFNRPKAFYTYNSVGDIHFAAADATGVLRFYAGGVATANLQIVATSTGVTLRSLGGVGSRMVVADANGALSATAVLPWRGSNLSAPPSSPVEGQMYSDTARKVYVYENTAWTPLNAEPLFA